MVGHPRVAHRPKKDRIEGAQLFQSVRRHHPSGAEISLAAPIEVLPRQRKAKAARCRLKHANPLWDHIAPDAVAFDNCNLVILHFPSNRLTLARYFSSFLNTCPPFITNLTRSSSVMSEVGSPDTATTSANLPASREPIRSCHPMSWAAPVVAASIVWTGVMPNFTMYSNSFVWDPWGKGPAPEPNAIFTPAATALGKLRSESSATLCPWCFFSFSSRSSW